ncbi:hypothetical protein OROGR_001493 [Orobanche gracilis]
MNAYTFDTAKATLNDSFLAHLDELSDNEDDHMEADNDDVQHMEEEINGDLAYIEALNYDDLDSVSKLQRTQRFTDTMQQVEYALEKGSENSSHGIVLEDDPEYQLIVDCNALSVDIENEIAIIHNFIRDKYRLKFPELESLVHHPIDYARVVKKIGNEMDLTLVDLEGLLPSAIIMVVSVTASTTSGKPLPEDILEKAVDACDRALALDSAKKKIINFFESRMRYIAPNLYDLSEMLLQTCGSWQIGCSLEFRRRAHYKFKGKSYGSGGATSGLTSNLAFTPVQGIELSNPQGNQLGGGTSTYFSETGTFSKIKRI